jgi:hypothetical protein
MRQFLRSTRNLRPFFPPQNADKLLTRQRSSQEKFTMRSSSKPSSIQFYLINPITSFLAPKPEEKKMGRDKKTYEGNVTASLSLQALPQKKKTAADMPGSSTSLMTSAFQAMSLISSSAVAVATAVSSAVSSTTPTTPTSVMPSLTPAAMTTVSTRKPRESKSVKKTKFKEEEALSLQIEDLQTKINSALVTRKDPTATEQIKTEAQNKINKYNLEQAQLKEEALTLKIKILQSEINNANVILRNVSAHPAKKAEAQEKFNKCLATQLQLKDEIPTLRIQTLQAEITIAAAIRKNPNTSVKIKKEALEKIEKCNLEQVDVIEFLIKEHASRRVDLFFYLLVAVYNQKTAVTKDSTDKQHGSGSKISGTEACHSSLFPNVKFTRQGMWTYLQGDLSLKGTHFENTLNMTVELPRIVNQFDCVLEGNFVVAAARFFPSVYSKNSLAILNKVASGEIDPKAGMDEFLNNLKDFFNQVERDYLALKQAPENTDENDLFKYSAAFKKVWKLQKEGTFAACKENTLTTSIKDEYIYMMLRADPLKANLMPGYLSYCYNYMQSEIFNTMAESAAPAPRPKP